jgi:hypothetical protein
MIGGKNYFPKGFLNKIPKPKVCFFKKHMASNVDEKKNCCIKCMFEDMKSNHSL